MNDLLLGLALVFVTGLMLVPVVALLLFDRRQRRRVRTLFVTITADTTRFREAMEQVGRSAWRLPQPERTPDAD